MYYELSYQLCLATTVKCWILWIFVCTMNLVSMVTALVIATIVQLDVLPLFLYAYYSLFGPVYSTQFQLFIN